MTTIRTRNVQSAASRAPASLTRTSASWPTIPTIGSAHRPEGLTAPAAASTTARGVGGRAPESARASEAQRACLRDLVCLLFLAWARSWLQDGWLQPPLA